MDSFEFRKVCNSLIAELNHSADQKNVVKLSIDIQLPDTVGGNQKDLTHPVRVIFDYLSNNLINGLINIEFLFKSSHHGMAMVQVKVIGQDAFQGRKIKKEDLSKLVKDAGVPIDVKENDSQIVFEFIARFQVLNTSLTEKKLPLIGKKILVVDDNEVNAMVFCCFLDEWGCETSVAVNGVEAIALAEGNRFDMILMDIHMPVLGGREATDKIRKFSKVPIIALTASTLEADIVDAMKAGASDYLLKPVTSADLFKVVSKYL